MSVRRPFANAEIARMRQDTGIEMGQQSGSEAGGISRTKCREKRVQVSLP